MRCRWATSQNPAAYMHAQTLLFLPYIYIYKYNNSHFQHFSCFYSANYFLVISIYFNSLLLLKKWAICALLIKNFILLYTLQWQKFQDGIYLFMYMSVQLYDLIEIIVSQILCFQTANSREQQHYEKEKWKNGTIRVIHLKDILGVYCGIL